MRGIEACAIPAAVTDQLTGRAFTYQGEIMATRREKDRKTRKKHQKNVKRMKALAKARRGGKKGKKG